MEVASLFHGNRDTSKWAFPSFLRLFRLNDLLKLNLYLVLKKAKNRGIIEYYVKPRGDYFNVRLAQKYGFI